MTTTILVALLAVIGQTEESESGRAIGTSRLFRGVLKSPGGELPFLFELAQGEHGLDGWLINGPERVKIPKVLRIKDRLTFDIAHYAATLSIKGKDWVFVGKERVPLLMEGEWTKRIGPYEQVKLDFTANVYQGYRFIPIPGPADRKAASADTKPAYPPISGRWLVRFSQSNDPAVGVFKQSTDGKVEGTFLTTTGDYRYLAGSYESGRLRLSVFDGAHAFLFDAIMQPDGTLEGDFWSRSSWHETWTAKRDDSATLPDAFGMVKWKDGVGFGSMPFPDTKGQLRALNDPEFKGKARIIEVFGTWCPNCHDEADLLVELDQRYRDEGLSILGLAFEVAGQREPDTKQVKRYAKRHSITFPILLAGEPEKKNVLAALPMLVSTHAYPTTIFMRRDGTIHAIHSGFSGPATGEAHEQLKKKFDAIVRELLVLPDEGAKNARN